LQLSELSTVDHEVFFANCVVGKSLYYSWNSNATCSVG
jgi:hypothetical protein